MRCPSPSNLPFPQLPRKRKPHVSSLFTCSRLSVLGEKRGRARAKTREDWGEKSARFPSSPPSPGFFSRSAPNFFSLLLPNYLEPATNYASEIWINQFQENMISFPPANQHSFNVRHWTAPKSTYVQMVSEMTQWWEPSPPTNVARRFRPGFRICLLSVSFVLLLALPGGYFPVFFPSSTKTNTTIRSG